ncbi:MAG: BspA family leucine-rich repeat surface protein, partial [Eggerthellaceae bacterium]|nr:BspA family leucine-rich repeat surface protein [Eggerthellaceae bacterium]
MAKTAEIQWHKRAIGTLCAAFVAATLTVAPAQAFAEGEGEGADGANTTVSTEVTAEATTLETETPETNNATNISDENANLETTDETDGQGVKTETEGDLTDPDATDETTLVEEVVEKVVTYKITLNAAGGTVDGEATKVLEVEAGKTATLPAASRGGYKFVGWATTEGATLDDVKYHEGDTLDAADVTLYAVWAKTTTVKKATAAQVQSFASSNALSTASASSVSMVTQADIDLTQPQYDFGDNRVYWTFSGGTLTITVLQAGATVNLAVGNVPWLSRLTPTEFYNVVIKRNLDTYTLKVSDLTGWFNGMSNLKTFEGGEILDTSSVLSFKEMFKDCTSLVSVGGSGSWQTAGRDANGDEHPDDVNFESMFQNCSSLREFAFDSWTVSANANRKNMFENAWRIKQLSVTNKVDFRDPANSSYTVGLETMESRGKYTGTWVKSGDDTWNTNHPDATTKEMLDDFSTIAAGREVYNFVFDSYFASSESHDKNVRWNYDDTNAILTIYIVDAAKDCTITEMADQVPWLKTFQNDAKNIIGTVIFKGLDQNDDIAKVRPTTLANWFQSYSGMSEFDGSGLDVSQVDSFANMFRYDSFLAKLDISAWDMVAWYASHQATAATGLANMVAGCNILRTIVVGNRVLLDGIGLTSLVPRYPAEGTWHSDDTVWFGTTANLVARYSDKTNGTDISEMELDTTDPLNPTITSRLSVDPTTGKTYGTTYTFVDSSLGGRFANDNVWWTWDTVEKILTIGADAQREYNGQLRNLASSELVVNVDNSSAPNYENFTTAGTVPVLQLPWLATGIVETNTLKQIVTQGNFKPTTLKGWFQNNDYLETFVGSGIDVSDTTSFEDLFAGCTRLAGVNLSGWNMRDNGQNPSNRATDAYKNMFYNCTQLRTLTVSGTAVLDNTTFFANESEQHAARHGSWITGNDAWFGSSYDLANRYNPTQSEVTDATELTYTFSTTTMSGRFKNTNVWWKYNGQDPRYGTVLQIGITDPNLSTEITENADNLPWLTTPGINIVEAIYRIVFTPSYKQNGDIVRVKPVSSQYAWGDPNGKQMENWFAATVAGGETLDKKTGNNIEADGGYKSLMTFDGAGLDTSEATSLKGLFKNCVHLSGIDNVGHWDLSNVTDMSEMFLWCQGLNDLPAGMDSWKATTGNVKNYYRMFWHCSYLDDVTSIAEWTLYQGTAQDPLNMEEMFGMCEYWANVDIHGWDMPTTGKYTNMFYSDWSIDRLTVGNGVILEGTGLNTAITARGDTRGSWGRVDTSDVEYEAPSTREWFGTSSNLVHRYSFTGTTKTVKTNYEPEENNFGTIIYVWSAKNLRGRFANDNVWWKFHGTESGLLELGVTNGSLSTTVNETAAEQPWRTVIGDSYTSDIKYVQVKAGSNLYVQNPEEWFMGYTALLTFDVGGMRLPSGASVVGLFDGCLNLDTVSNLQNWNSDIANVTSFERMFKNNQQLTGLTGVSGWTTTNLTSVKSMFEGCLKLGTLTEISSWDVSKVNDYSSFLSGDLRLQALDISGWEMYVYHDNDNNGAPITATAYTADTDHSTYPNVTTTKFTDMLKDCVSLGTTPNGFLKLSATSIIDGATSGFNNSLNSTALGVGRMPTQGAWVLSEIGGNILWFGSSNNLAARYPTTAKQTAARNLTNPAVHVYTWDPDRRTGRFDSNDYVWWSYDGNGTLSFGSELAYQTNPEDYTVTEVQSAKDAVAADRLPWVTIVGRNNIKHITTQLSDGLIRVTDLRNWFADYPNLESFDGSAFVTNFTSTEYTGLNAPYDNVSNSFERLFADDPKLKSATGFANWDVHNITSFKQMFQNDTQLGNVSTGGVVSGLTWKAPAAGAGYTVTDALADVSYMFDGCANLDVMNETASWDVTGVTNFTAFLNGAAKLRQLSLLGWEMNETADRANMLKGLANLQRVVIGPNAGLIGANFTSNSADISTRTIQDGSWRTLDDSWRGSTSNIAWRYANDHSRSGASLSTTNSYTYIWYPNEYYGRFTWLSGDNAGKSNDNVWWIYFTEAGSYGGNAYAAKTLLIGASNAAGETKVLPNITAAQLPWLDITMTASAKIKTSAEIIATVGAAVPATLASWFADYTSLKTFNASGLNLTGTGDAVYANMLQGDTLLETLVLPKDIILTGSGLSGLSTRQAHQGMWVMGNDLWFDSSAELENRYGTAQAMKGRFYGTYDTNGRLYGYYDENNEATDSTDSDVTPYDPTHPAGNVTYTWDNTRLGGRFPSNQNVWWTFVIDPDDDNVGLLTIGGDGSSDETTTVTEYGDIDGNNGPGMPWLVGRINDYKTYKDSYSAVSSPSGNPKTQGYYTRSGAGTTASPYVYTLTNDTSVKNGTTYYTKSVVEDVVGTDNILSVTTTGTIAPQNLTAWFANLAKLETFSGLHLDTANVVNLTKMFYQCESLKELNDVNGWNTGSAENFDYMLAGLTAIKKLSLYGWNTTAATSMQYMFADDVSLTDLVLALKGGNSWNLLREGGTPVNQSNMFYNLKRLTWLTVSGTMVLKNAGFESDESNASNNLADHGKSDGSWAWNGDQGTGEGGSAQAEGGDPDAEEPFWEGSTSDLSSHYTLTAKTSTDEWSLTRRLYWRKGRLFGLFNNQNVWWRYITTYVKDDNDEDTDEVDYATLSIGRVATPDGDDFTVTEYGTSLPWRSFVETGAADCQNFIYRFVANNSRGTVGIENFSDWFLNHKYLETSNTPQINLAPTTSMYQTFAGCTALTSVTNLGTGGATTSALTTVEKMFYMPLDANDPSHLTTITGMGNWVTTEVTKFDQAFYNCTELQGLDIHNWDMISVTGDGDINYGDGGYAGTRTTVPTRSYMLTNDHNLRTMALGVYVVLDETGFEDTLTTLGVRDGMWLQRDSNDNDVWFDTTSRLSDRYSVATGNRFVNRPAANITYVWDDTRIGGRFLSDSVSVRGDAATGNTWWTWTRKGDNRGLLEMGTYDGAAGTYKEVTELATDSNVLYASSGTAGDAYNATLVTKDNYTTVSANVLPWRIALAIGLKDTTPIDPDAATPTYTEYNYLTDITDVKTYGSLAPVNMAAWFQNHTNLYSFDGSGLDVSNTTTMSKMFNHAPKLGAKKTGATSRSTVTGIADWTTTKELTDLSYMFASDYELTTLPNLSKWYTGMVTNFSYMFYDSYSLQAINGIGVWDTRSATTFNSMFAAKDPGVHSMSITDLNLAGWHMRTHEAITDATHDTTIAARTADPSAVNFLYGCADLKEFQIGQYFTAETKAAPTRRYTVETTHANNYTTSNQYWYIYAPGATYILLKFDSNTEFGGHYWYTPYGSDYTRYGGADSFTVTYGGPSLAQGSESYAWNGTPSSRMVNSTRTLTTGQTVNGFETWVLTGAQWVDLSLIPSLSNNYTHYSRWGFKVDIYSDADIYEMRSTSPYAVFTNEDLGTYGAGRTDYAGRLTAGVANVGTWERTSGGSAWKGTAIDLLKTENDTTISAISGTTMAGTYTFQPGVILGRFNSNLNVWWELDNNIANSTTTAGTLTLHGADSAATSRVEEKMPAAYPNDVFPYSTKYSNEDTPSVPWDFLRRYWRNTGLTFIYNVVDTEGTIAPDFPAYWFCDYPQLKTISISGMSVTTRVTSLSHMFATNPLLTKVTGLSLWQTGNVTTMEALFSGDYILGRASDNGEINTLANWNVSKCLNFKDFFKNCAALTVYDGVRNWTLFTDDTDPAKVINMQSMFQNSGITALDMLSNWVTSRVKNFSYMFAGCVGLTNATGIAGWSVGKLSDQSTNTTVESMFDMDGYNSTVLTTVDLSKWEMRTGLTIKNLLRNCRALLRITLSEKSNLGVRGAADDTGLNNTLANHAVVNGMWKRHDYPTPGTWRGPSSNLQVIYGATVKFNSDNAVWTYNWDSALSGGHFAYGDGIDNTWWYYERPLNSSDTTGGVLHIGTDGSGNLEVEDMSPNHPSTNPTTKGGDPITKGLPWADIVANSTTPIRKVVFEGGIVLINPQYWFKGYTNLLEVDASGLDLSEVSENSLAGIFQGCTNLKSITGVDGWPLQDVENMSYLFDGCTNLTEIQGVRYWQSTPNLTNVSFMFRGTTNLFKAKVKYHYTMTQDDDGDYVTDNNGTSYRKYNSNSDPSTMTRYKAVKDETNGTFGTSDDGLTYTAYTAPTDTEKYPMLAALVRWDVSHVTTFESMFENSTWLETLDFIKDWQLNTNSADFAIGVSDTFSLSSGIGISLKNMFKNCTHLTKADLSGWDVTYVKTFEGMFSGATSLQELDIHTWTMPFSYSKATYYPEEGHYLVEGGVYYKYVALADDEDYAGTKYKLVDGAYSEYDSVNDSAYDGAFYKKVTATKGPQNQNVKEDGVDAAWIVTKPASASYAAQTPYMTGAMIQDMLYNCYSLNKMYLGPGVVLCVAAYNTDVDYNGNISIAETIESGFHNSLSNRGAWNGRWQQLDNSWFDGTANLAERYRYGSPTKPNSYEWYEWKQGLIGGHFLWTSANTLDNVAAKWQFDSSTGTLYIGLDDDASNTTVGALRSQASIDNWSSAYYYRYGSWNKTDNNLPWLRHGVARPSDVLHIVFQRNNNGDSLAPLTPANWFARYYRVTDIDGYGFDASRASNFSQMFHYCYSLKTLNNTGTWSLGTHSSASSNTLNLTRMFYNNDALTTTAGIDTWTMPNNVNFTEMFYDCDYLNKVDFTGFKAADGSHFKFLQGTKTLTNMLLKTPRLATIIVDDQVVLKYSATNHVGIDASSTRPNNTGSWKLTSMAWFGNSTALEDRYTNGAGGAQDDVNRPLGVFTYVWDSTALAGRFPSNPNAWWRFYIGATTAGQKGFLEIGTDSGPNKNIAETRADIEALWLTYPGVDTFNFNGTTTAINRVVFTGSPHINTPANWFSGYKRLEMFNGANLNTTDVTSFTRMFQNDPLLVDLINMNDWNVDALTDVSYMFAGCTQLKTNRGTATDANAGINKWHMLNVTDFSHMFEGCTALNDLDLTAWDMVHVPVYVVDEHGNFVLSASLYRKYNDSTDKSKDRYSESYVADDADPETATYIMYVTDDNGQTFREYRATTDNGAVRFNLAIVEDPNGAYVTDDGGDTYRVYNEQIDKETENLKRFNITPTQATNGDFVAETSDVSTTYRGYNSATDDGAVRYDYVATEDPDGYYVRTDSSDITDSAGNHYRAFSESSDIVKRYKLSYESDDEGQYVNIDGQYVEYVSSRDDAKIRYNLMAGPSAEGTYVQDDENGTIEDYLGRKFRLWVAADGTDAELFRIWYESNVEGYWVTEDDGETYRPYDAELDEAKPRFNYVAAETTDEIADDDYVLDANGDVTISDGRKFRLYDASLDVVTRYNLGYEVAAQGQYVTDDNGANYREYNPTTDAPAVRYTLVATADDDGQYVTDDDGATYRVAGVTDGDRQHYTLTLTETLETVNVFVAETVFGSVSYRKFDSLSDGPKQRYHKEFVADANGDYVADANGSVVDWQGAKYREFVSTTDGGKVRYTLTATENNYGDYVKDGETYRLYKTGDTGQRYSLSLEESATGEWVTDDSSAYRAYNADTDSGKQRYGWYAEDANGDYVWDSTNQVYRAFNSATDGSATRYSLSLGTKTVNLANMFTNCRSLRTMLLDNDDILVGSGFDNNIYNRGARDGRWVLEGNGWFDNTSKLAALYKLGGNTRGNELLYTWDDTTLGGRFESDERAWWYFVRVKPDGTNPWEPGDNGQGASRWSTTNPGGTLYIGTEVVLPGEDPVVVSEKYYELPWIGIVESTFVRNIVTQGDLHILHPAMWFSSDPYDNTYKNLTWNYTQGGNVSVNATTGTSVSGTVTISQGGWWDSGCYSTVTLEKGKTYVVDMDYRFEDVHNADSRGWNVYLDLRRWYDRNTGYYWYEGMPRYMTAWLDKTGDWNHVRYVITVAETGTYYLGFCNTDVGDYWRKWYTNTGYDYGWVRYRFQNLTLREAPGYATLVSFDGGGVNLERTYAEYDQVTTGTIKLNTPGTAPTFTSLGEGIQGLHGFFSHDDRLTDLTNMGDWRVDKVFDLSYMFEGCEKINTGLANLVQWGTTGRTRYVTTMKAMFKNCASLQGNTNISTWNTANVEDFSHMFDMTDLMTKWKILQNYTTTGIKLTDYAYSPAFVTLDISKWNMQKAATNASMQGFLSWCVNIAKIVASGTSTLGLSEGSTTTSPSGLDDTLLMRESWNGRWVLQNPPTGRTWWDNSLRLAGRYPLGANKHYDPVYTYVWDADHAGGRFEANEPAWCGTWWTLDINPDSPTYRTLTIGADDGTDAYRTVTMTRSEGDANTSAHELPWYGKVGAARDQYGRFVAEDGTVSYTLAEGKLQNYAFIKDITTQGDVRLQNPANWFAGYKNLETFDGSGMNMSLAASGNVGVTTSVANMFANDKKLTNVKNIGQWNMAQVKNFTGMFRNVATLANSCFEQLRNWTMTGAEVLSHMFDGALLLSDLTPLKDWNVSNVWDFSYLFANCTGLTTQEPIAGWKVAHKGAGFTMTMAHMFENALNIVTMDLSTWIMKDATLTGFFDGCKGLVYIKTGKATVLEGSGFASFSAHTINDGSWARLDATTRESVVPAYSNSGDFLANRLYKNAGNDLDVYWYEFVSLIQGTFESNLNVWWSYNVRTGVLTIGYGGTADEDNVASRKITEVRNSLPWKDLAPDTLLELQQTKPDATIYDLITKVQFQDVIYLAYPESWFMGHTALTEAVMDKMRFAAKTNSSTTSIASLFEGSNVLESISGTENWNTDIVSDFSSAFKGASSLKMLNLTGWEMVGKTVTDMLAGCVELVDLGLSENVVLQGSGIDNADKTPSRQLYAGTWFAGANQGDMTSVAGETVSDWRQRGSSYTLANTLYPSGTTRPVSATTWYHWDTQNYFPERNDIRWQFVQENTYRAYNPATDAGLTRYAQDPKTGEYLSDETGAYVIDTDGGTLIISYNGDASNPSKFFTFN